MLTFWNNICTRVFPVSNVQVAQRLDGFVCLLDDVLVHGKTVSEHDKYLAKVIQIMQKAGMT